MLDMDEETFFLTQGILSSINDCCRLLSGVEGLNFLAHPARCGEGSNQE